MALFFLLSLVWLVGASLIYFSPPFRRYDKQHTTHVYICPNGMVGVRGGSIVSTYHWAQVQAVSLNAYKRASEYKLQLVDGRQIIIKGMYQPTPKGMGSAIEGALANYRTQRQG